MRDDRRTSASLLPVERGRREALKVYARRLWILLAVVATNALLVVGIYAVKHLGGETDSGDPVGSILGLLGAVLLLLVGVVVVLSVAMLLLYEAAWIVRMFRGWGRDTSRSPDADVAKHDS
jgi:uncharacterized membrane protein